MKSELLKYYPYIKESQIFVVGTPQFESHFDRNIIEDRTQFFARYDMDVHKKYICYSGDDITTCPDDPQYLSDLANAIRTINKKNEQSLGIIFRRCPVDFSNRYEQVLERNKDLIVSIDPIWKKIGEGWDTVLPTKDDVKLLSNTVYHSEMVVNMGSSMIFDFICHDRPCGYFRYNQEKQIDKNWNIFKCYRYVHFRSMPEKNPVFFIDNPASIADLIEEVLKNSNDIKVQAREWFKIVNQHPPQLASERTWEAITQIVK